VNTPFESNCTERVGELGGAVSSEGGGESNPLARALGFGNARERSHGHKTRNNRHSGRGVLYVPMPGSTSRVDEPDSATVFRFFGGGGGRYVTTLAFFCGGSFGVMAPILSGSLNFPLLTSDAFDLPFPLAVVPFRVGGFRVDHSESGEGGNWS